MSNLFTNALGRYSDHLVSAKGSSSSSVGLSVILAVLSAILGFASAYAIYQIQRRREPRKQLSWELQSKEVQLEVSSEIKERVGVLYRDTRVQNLTAVTCVVSNTGNRVVKNEQIRFNFGEQAQVLEHSLYPTPEPELGVIQVDDHGLTSLDFVYRIGQLEIGQHVRFLFVLASQNPIVSPAPYAKNEEGDVPFVRRGTERIVADQEHLRPFFITLFLFLVVPLIFTPISGAFTYDFGGVMLLALRIILLMPLLPHLIPVARLAEQLVVRYLSSDMGHGAGNSVFGGEFNGPVLQGATFSNVTFPSSVEAGEVAGRAGGSV